MIATVLPLSDADGLVFGHPRGLAYIAFTEAWERFSFYGMQALLVLYMSTHLLQPDVVGGVIGFAGLKSAVDTVFGELTVKALATQLFGLYVGFIYFTPVLGGYLGDRFTGRRAAVVLGGVLMAVGHFLMAFEALFVFAASALIVGCGLLKGNLAAQVGDLYPKDDARRGPAFSVYVLAINTGAFVAPLVCGTLGELYGWHYGFGAAGVGMIIGLIIYLSGTKHLPLDHDFSKTEERSRLQSGDGRIVVAILAMLAMTALYWTAQAQVWNTYPLWVKDRVDRTFADLTVPVTWFQSLDSLAVLVLAPAVIWWWQFRAQRREEQSDLTRIAIGCAIFAAADVWLMLGELSSGAGKVALFWPVVFHFVCAVGYLYVGPIALALTSRAAPTAVNAMMVGSYYLAIFVGGIVSGWLGRFYEQMTPGMFWLLHAFIVGCGAVFTLQLKRPFERILTSS